MKVFVVPSWHPTPTKPLWCNWILPHIALLNEAGVDAYVLQLGLDEEPIPDGSDPWGQPVRHIDANHLYVPVPSPTQRYHRTRFCYGAFLRKYLCRLREVYLIAVRQWGRPDLIHAHVSVPGGFLAAQIGREFGVPVIVQEHYTGFESDARYPWRVGSFVREMGRQVEGFYAVSPGYARRIEKTGLVSVTGTLPNPIDTDLFAPGDYAINEGVLRIVTAGSMTWHKGSDLLFEALNILSPVLEWHLTLFGDTPDLSKYSRWLNDANFANRISLPGKVPQTELVSAYNASDLYVVSSRIETANVSMLQAMACGVPVLTTSCGAPETLIDESVGMAVRPGEPDALAEGILKMSKNLQSYVRSNQRRFVVDRYSKPVAAKLVLEAYELAISS